MVKSTKALSAQNPHKKNTIRIPLGEHIFNAVNVIIMCLLCVCVLIPLIHVVAASFSSGLAYMRHNGLLLWPVDFSLDAYKEVLKNTNIWTGYANTIFLVVVGTLLQMLFTTVCAYVLTRKGVMLGRFLNLFMLFTMYFTGGMIPFYLVVKNVGLYNSRWALILPTLISVFNLVIMRTAVASVPESLVESAQLDGANHLVILTNIIVPLIKPTLAVICLYYAVSNWNSWFNAMLFLKDRAKYPLQLILREILILNNASSSDNTDVSVYMSETIQYATIVVATLPVLCIYPFVQKYFVKGVMVGAVKG
jgi:putative aldouronate transport system permease protein